MHLLDHRLHDSRHCRSSRVYSRPDFILRFSFRCRRFNLAFAGKLLHRAECCGVSVVVPCKPFPTSRFDGPLIRRLRMALRGEEGEPVPPTIGEDNGDKLVDSTLPAADRVARRVFWGMLIGLVTIFAVVIIIVVTVPKP